MTSELRKQIISEWTGMRSVQDKIVMLFERVRDIPYGSIGSRDPGDVYTAHEGTCSGKHELLKELYQELGLETKDYIAMHRFKDMTVSFPEQLQQILDRSDIVDPHNFFKLHVEGRWVTVDVTWDFPLKKMGFVVNEDWDGKTDMELCVVPLSISETDDPMAFKKNEIAHLTSKVQADRKLFLDELTKWVKTLRV
jgi:hypothetical protein